MSLNCSNWKPFKINKLFLVKGSKTTPKEELESIGKGEYPYITTSAYNNGVEGYYNHWTEKGGVITIESACMGFASYQAKNFSASDHVEILQPKYEMSSEVLLFITTLINKENYRFSYGRKCNQKKIKELEIKLPVDNEGEPDWKLMKEHINSLKHKPITTQNNKTEKIDIRDWKEFRFGDYVKDDEIYKAKKYNKEDLTISKTDNGIPYITRTEPNNSCEFMAIKDEYEYIEKGNAIVIGDTTSTISYQEENFICGDHIVVIRPEWLNKYNGLFITTMLKQERFRYCYGRAFLMETIKNTKLLLPEKNGEPDWAYMEKYMKSLPYGDRI